MKVGIEKTPARRRRLLAIAFSFGLALLVWSVGQAHADGDKPTATTTAVNCAPASAEFGQSVHCTATVTGVIGATDGEVLFKSENRGAFSAGTCELSVGEKGKPASCSVDYVPADDGAAKHTVHALYGGDAANAPSSGVFAITILSGGGGGKGGGKDEGSEGGGGKPDKTTPSPRTSHTKAKPHRRKRRACRSHCGQSRGKAHSSKRG